jgi:hypothetical protein
MESPSRNFPVMNGESNFWLSDYCGFFVEYWQTLIFPHPP